MATEGIECCGVLPHGANSGPTSPDCADFKMGRDDHAKHSALAACCHTSLAEAATEGEQLPSIEKDGPQPLPPERRLRSGSGYGGVRTATDDFVDGVRKTRWHRPVKPAQELLLPPRLYYDHHTIIREVADVCTLRRGDHCLIAINMVRSLSPNLDYLVSYLGSLELCYFYHHFVLVDDVSYLDDAGVPRTASGELAFIIEYANTIGQAYEEVRVCSGGRPWRVPLAAFSFLFRKAQCRRIPLADYGDMPHLYVVVKHLEPEERMRIVENALSLEKNHRPYHFLLNNCEHNTNQVCTGEFTSPLVSFALWSMFRMSLTLVGLYFLYIVAGRCYTTWCLSAPLWAMAAYNLFTSVPVVLQATITYGLFLRGLRRLRARQVINSDDYYHLRGKECARMILVGGSAAAVYAAAPWVIRKTQLFGTTCAVCAFAYLVPDLVYNLLSHAFMRLVLLPLFGRVWLLSDGGKVE